jgi:hypothetical protein
MMNSIKKSMAHFGIPAFSVGGRTIKAAKVPTLRSCTVDGMTGKVVIHVGDKVRVIGSETGSVPATYTIKSIMRSDTKDAYDIVADEGNFFLTSNKHGTVEPWFNRFEVLERAKKSS